jgi:ParB-like chromosome segregation protein Spo0J
MIKQILKKYQAASFDEKVGVYNQITQELYDFLGLNHPTLNVQLIPLARVEGNDYNPNKVPPPEMRLLKLSVRKDGLTMPVVVAAEKKKENWVIVDGFHRTAICRNTKDIRESLKGYLPVTRLNKTIENRVAATVRHNMARGTHQVELSARLVAFLKRNDWSNQRIGDELGMDADEVLRLRQITGLAEAFQNEDFSRSWDV